MATADEINRAITAFVLERARWTYLPHLMPSEAYLANRSSEDRANVSPDASPRYITHERHSFRTEKERDDVVCRVCLSAAIDALKAEAVPMVPCTYPYCNEPNARVHAAPASECKCNQLALLVGVRDQEATNDAG